MCINGGLHVGGESAAGDNNMIVDGTSLISGVATFADDLSSPSFSSGFAGAGFKLDLTTGEYTLTVDNLSVRKMMTVYELDINKIQSVNGGIVVSSANGACLTVSALIGGANYDIWFDEDNGSKPIQFAVGDIIRAQIWTGRGIASYIGEVVVVHHDNTYGAAYISTVRISGTPWAGAEFVQVGNSATAARQNFIYITASDTNNPYIDMLAGVTDGNFSGKQKLRIGNLTGITDAVLGALSGYGLWSDNVYLTGKMVLPTAGITNEGSAASSVRIYAGDTYANRASAPFRVVQDGKMYATAGEIAGWTITTTALTGSHGGVTMSLGKDGDIVIKSLQYYNYSQQSTPVTLSAPLAYMYICLDNNAESTLNLPSSGLPGSGSSQMLIINHKYGTGLGAAKYHIQGNGYYIIDAGSQVSSIDIDEGHSVILTWEPRGTSWYVTSKN